MNFAEWVEEQEKKKKKKTAVPSTYAPKNTSSDSFSDWVAENRIFEDEDDIAPVRDDKSTEYDNVSKALIANKSGLFNRTSRNNKQALDVTDTMYADAVAKGLTLTVDDLIGDNGEILTPEEVLKRKNGTSKSPKLGKDKSSYPYANMAGSVAKSNTTPFKNNEATKSNTWFDDSWLDDGWQWSDLKAIPGSFVDIGKNLGQGAIGIGEKIVDAMTMLGASQTEAEMMRAANNQLMVNTLLGKTTDENYLDPYLDISEQVKEGASKFVAKDLYDEAEIAKALISDPFKKIGLDSEEYSVFGEKSDALAVSGGQLLGQLGADAVLPGSGMVLMGVTAFGSEAENAFLNGATFNEALGSATVSAAAELLTERLGGISFGGKTLTDVAVDALSKRVSSKVGKYLLRLGKFTLDSTTEGIEEDLSGYLSAVGQKMTYMSDKELEELFSDEDHLDSFIGGVVLGGFGEAGNVVKSKVNGVDYVTGNTKNEQAVIDKEIENRISEAEKNGNKLTSKEKSKIAERVAKDLERGYISTDTIESVLGGDSYKAYTDAVEGENSLAEQEESLTKEYNDLNKKLWRDMTGEEMDRREELKTLLPELRAKIKANKESGNTAQLKSKLFSEVEKLTRNDYKLRESYNELARAGQGFKADFDKYKGTKHEDAARKTLENATKAGASNTNRVHDIVDMAAHMSAESGLVYDFKSAEEIKNDFIERQTKEIAKFEALENPTAEQVEFLGKMKEQLAKVKSGDLIVDGDITGNGIVLNYDSAKPLNRIIGHEITHSLEKADSYNQLRDHLFNYAKSKGVDVDAQIKALEQKYAGVKDANAEAELVADLVGDYIFTDSEYVKRLTAENRTLAQWCLDKITHLYKMATAGSKEARELERAKSAFEDALREAEQNRAEVQEAQDEQAIAEEFSDANTNYSIREKAPPTKTIEGYKVFIVKDGKLYPPMVANPEGEGTPVGVWLDADVGGLSYDESGNVQLNDRGRFKVKAGGKGTQGGGGELAFRPGWHLGEYPDASQFGRDNAEHLVTNKKGKLVPARELFPYDFVWARCEVAADNDYQLDAMSFGVNENGKFERTQAGLPYIPEDGYYKYRTNADPNTAPWIISGSIKVVEILDDEQVAKICAEHGVTPQQRQAYTSETIEAYPSGNEMREALTEAGVEFRKSAKVAELRALYSETFLNGEIPTKAVYSPEARPGGKIDLSMFGLNAGQVTPTSEDVLAQIRQTEGTAATRKAETAELLKTLPGYAKRKINFEDANIIKEFGMNNQSVDEYRAKAEETGHGYLVDEKIYSGDVAPTKYSLSDSNYIDAVNRGDTETAQKMVDEAAKNAGYDSRVFHGTEKFGFTKFDTSFSDDQISVFATSDPNTARTYSRTGGTRGINESFDKTKNSEDFEQEIARIDGAMRKRIDSWSSKVNSLVGKDGYVKADDIYDMVTQSAEAVKQGRMSQNRAEKNVENYIQKTLKDGYDAKLHNGEPFRKWQKTDEYLELSQQGEALYEYAVIADKSKSKALQTSGNYDLYANTDGLLVIEGNGANWDDIQSDILPSITSDEYKKYENDRSDGKWTTRSVAKYAFDNGYKGVLFKSIYDNGGKVSGGLNEAADVYAFFHPESQLKSADTVTYDDNGNVIPLSQRFNKANDDIRYSLSDSNGNQLSPAVQNRFAKSKVVDENGSLKVVYHGTATGEFTIFDKAKGSVEGDFGSGFYFTDNADDVSRNYEGGGPDFDNKIDRRAEQIEAEEDISYAAARKRAIQELYVGSHKFEVYLNIENPAVVGKTTLLDYESFAEEYDRNDYDSDEDYESDVEYLISDKIDEIIWEVEKNVDVYSTDGLADVLWNAVNEGGIDIEQLKANINELYLEDSNGNMVGNEVTRQIIESLGYDGIIDPTVSGKWNMEMEAGTTHYIVFKPNQIKNVSNQNPTDNPDINLSLSNKGEDIAPTPAGGYDFYGKDFHRNKIVNKLTGKEISKKTYEVLGKLERGEATTLDELNSLPEVVEGMERVKEDTAKFLAEHPEFKDVRTKDLGTHLVNSAEREQLRSRILKERLESGSFTHIDNDGKEVYNGSVEKGKRLDIVIGLPAAGKSTSVVLPLSQHYKSVVVDSDIVKEKLPEFNGGWGTSLVHEDSSKINMRMLGEELSLGNNIVLPIVGAKTGSVDNYIRLAKEKGYSIYLHLNELNSSKAMGRNLGRYFSQGRFIPPEIAWEKGDKPTAVYEEMKSRGDISGYSHWNNDVQRGQRPTLVDISGNLRVYGEYSNSWRAVRATDVGRDVSTSETGKYADLGNGVGGLQSGLEADAPRRENSEGSVGLPRIVRLSTKTQEAFTKSGVVSFELIDSSDDSNAFSIALDEARTADAENGWAVTPKSAEELVKNNIRTIMSADGKAGLGVAPDGDIEAVFKNKNGGPNRALDTLIPAALEIGGNKLDCYGTGLVRLYSQYGFVPVARVTFNQEFANDGWTPDKGEPDIFFMVHNGDSPDTVIANKGKYKEYTAEELDALPLFSKDDYDPAYAYRDGKLPQMDFAPVRNDMASAEAPVAEDIAPVNEATKRSEVESVVGNKDGFMSKRATELYEEITSLKKGVRASQRLGYLLDHGYDWRSIKTALLNIRDNPNQVVNPNSAAESTAREMLGREYDSMVEDFMNAEGVTGNIYAKMQSLSTELENNQRLREQSSADFDSEIARLQAEYDGKKNQNTKVANDILRRIERIKRLKSQVDADYGKRIDKLGERLEKMSKPEYKTAMQRKQKQSEYTSLMENLVGNTATWVDKKLGLSYKVNTLRRNLRDIVRDANGNPDIEKADAIYDELQGKYNHNEAELKRESARIKEVFQKMNLNHAEDTYAHMLGEFRHNPDSKLTEEDVKDYYNKHKKKIDTAKVDTAIEESRKVFDELIVRVNERLREQGMKEIPYRQGYFPHFKNPKQTWLHKFFNWKPVDNEIPTSIAGLTEDFNPQRSWQSFNKERKGDTTDYSLEQGLDSYIHGALDWIYHIEDIQKRRALENHIRYTHSEEGIRKRIDAIRNNETYDADEMQQHIDAVYAEANNPLNNFVTDLRAGTNTLANKKSSMDRKTEEMTNRKIYSVMTNLNNRINANMVVGSFSSALTNFIPITQSWMEVSPVYSLKGMRDTIKSTIRDDGVVNKSDFLTNRFMNEEKLYQTGWDKVSDKAAFMMEAIDSFTSQTVWRSKYLQNISEGMSEVEAIKNADQFAENVIAGRSRGNQPTIFDAKNPLTKIFTAFQLEVNNQYGYMFKDAPQDSKNKARLVKGYATAFLGAYAYNALYSSLVGRNAAFDPISILEDLFKDLFGDDDDEEDALLNLADNVLEEVPFVGGLVGGGRIPLSSAMPYNGDYKTFVTDLTNGELSTKEMLKPIYYLAMPVAGGQIKKTNEGLAMFSDDHPVSGSYTESGNLRFPVEDTLGNKVQAAMFGQYASKNARDYFDNGRSPLNEKQIQEYIDVDIPIRDYWEYREGLAKQKTVDDKFDYIADLDLPVSKKNILINNIVDRKEDVDMTGYEDFSSYDEFDFATKNPGKYAVSQVVGDYSTYSSYYDAINDLTADKDEDGKSINGSRKEKVVSYIESLPLDYGQKCILFKSQYKADDSMNMDIIEYLDSREDIDYDEMVTILTELGFTVDGNNIYWD